MIGGAPWPDRSAMLVPESSRLGKGKSRPRTPASRTPATIAFDAYRAAFTGSHFRHGGGIRPSQLAAKARRTRLLPRLTAVASYATNTAFLEGVIVDSLPLCRSGNATWP